MKKECDYCKRPFTKFSIIYGRTNAKGEPVTVCEWCFKKHFCIATTVYKELSEV